MNTSDIIQVGDTWHLNLPKVPNAYQAATYNKCAAHAFRVRNIDAVRVLDCAGRVVKFINRKES